MPEQLQTVDCPVEVEYIWHWFDRLSSKRSNNGFSYSRITNAEILAWSQLREIALMPFEIDAIEALDEAYMRHQQAKVKI